MCTTTCLIAGGAGIDEGAIWGRRTANPRVQAAGAASDAPRRTDLRAAETRAARMASTLHCCCRRKGECARGARALAEIAMVTWRRSLTSTA